ncbi:MAG: ABC transporter permease [Lachnospiraceae bacterium]|nr:ABC transporter permease [Lachnospiraceae bacterium]
MNSFKIALRNMKKSKKDYSVYFLTLILGVAIFYMFNSLDGQGAMKSISRSTNSVIEMLVYLIEGVSVLIALVLGLLIVYANNFLIKRRKKEFGLYMLLGMGRRKVSKILVAETGIVGLMSFAVGIALGIFGSQFFSIIVAKMFDIDLSAYRFTFSMSAFIKTAVNYAVIFIAVLIFNTITVSKYKLLDLLHADKKQEKSVLKSSIASAIIFVIALAVLTYADIRVCFFSGDMRKKEFIFCLLGGLVAVFVLFLSVSGFIFDIIKRFKKFYSKNLNSFVTRQFCGNVNSSSVSMALICLMLMASLVIFSTGFSLRSFINAKIGNGGTPVDVSIRCDGEEATEVLKRNGVEISEIFSDYVEIPMIKAPGVITLGSLLGDYISEGKENFIMADWDYPQSIMSLSDYNKLQDEYGRKEIKLEDDEYLVICDFQLYAQFADKALAAGTPITIGETTLYPAEKKCLDEFILMSGMGANGAHVILPDYVMEENPEYFEDYAYILGGNYVTKDKNESYKYDDAVKIGLGIDPQKAVEEVGPIMVATKNEVRDSGIGTTVLVVFLVLYIGVIFVLSCAAIIALKVLSDGIDSAGKFKILGRMGVTPTMQKRALFSQVLLNFALPLVVALAQALFALGFVREGLRAFGLINMGSGIMFALLVMVIIYGGYFVTTYINTKRVVDLR